MSSSNSTSSFALDYRPLPAQFQDCSATPSKRRHPLLHSCQQKPQRHPHVRNPHSHPQQQPALPRTITIMAFIHILCLCLCALSTLANAGDQEDRATRACFHLPRTLDRTCACSPVENGGVALSCKGLNNTEAFDLELEETETKDEYEVRGNDILGGSRFPEEYRQLLWEQVMSIEVTDSAIRAVKMSDFARYRHLAKLSVTGSKVSQFLIDGGRAEASRVQRVGRQRDGKTDLTLLRLETLDLSLNELTELDAESLGELTHLKTINVSGNALHQLSPVFGSLEQLEVLDLSSNQLDESLNPKVLQDLPKSLKYLDISSKNQTAISNTT